MLEKYFTDEKVNGIIICNPNNPTGLLYPEDFLNKIGELAVKYNKKIIIDEVYYPLISANNLEYKNSFYLQYPNNTIAVWSFSKGWGIPGWRLGFILANINDIIKITGLQSTINTCPSSSSQDVAIKLLKNKWLPIDDFNKLNYYKNRLITFFKNKGWEIPDNPITSMYIFPYNNNINIQEYIDKLFEAGLAVMPGEPFGIKNSIRLTIYNKDSIMKKYIKILESV